MDAKQTVLTQGLPKTGQTEIYDSVDDGLYQAGWWRGEREAPYKTRFILKGTSPNQVTIDRATGLMWAADAAHKGCAYNATLTWLLALQYANDLDFAGFNDWRMPNIFELLSIMDFSKLNPAIDTDFFLNTSLGIYWSSTTRKKVLTQAWVVTATEGDTVVLDKTNMYYLRSVRGGL